MPRMLTIGIDTTHTGACPSVIVRSDHDTDVSHNQHILSRLSKKNGHEHEEMKKAALTKKSSITPTI